MAPQQAWQQPPQWQPASHLAAASPPLRSRTISSRLVALIAVAAVIVAAVAFGITRAAIGGSTAGTIAPVSQVPSGGAGPASTPEAPAPVAPSSIPTGSKYADVVVADSAALLPLALKLKQDCGASGTLTGCRAAASAEEAEAGHILGDLVGLPVPAAKAAADVTLRAALTDIRDGDVVLVAGLDAHDSARAQTGLDQRNRGLAAFATSLKSIS